MPDELKKANFDPHLNSKFEIHAKSVGVVEIELVEITEKNAENMESFSLIFRGPENKVFNQETHKVKHPKMGEFNMFIGPIIHEKKDGIYYQAVFNRLIENK